VSPTDRANLTGDQIKELDQLTIDWNKAFETGNTAGMKAANEAANLIRATAGYSGGSNGNTIIVSSGNRTNTVVINDTTSVNNSGTINTVNVLAGANTSITNSGTIERITNSGTVNSINNSGSIGTINSSGTIGTINNSGTVDVIRNSGTVSAINNSGIVGTVNNFNSGTVGIIDNSGSVGIIHNSGTITSIYITGSGSISAINNINTIGYISTGKSTNTIITNSGAVSGITTGANSYVTVNNTGLINSIYLGSNGTLYGTNDGFVERISGGADFRLSYQWNSSSAKTLLLMQNQFILNYLLTKEERTAGVLASRIGGKLYKDFSNPMNTALKNAETEFGGKFRLNYGWFISQVDHGKPWDIKLRDPWNNKIGAGTFPGQQTSIVVNGQITTPHELGNMTYGYLGTALGLTQLELLSGGDFAAGSYGKSNAWTKFWGGVGGVLTRADSPEDKIEIKAGIQWYKNTR